MIYKGLVNGDKLCALYPEGNSKPLKCFMQKSDIRFIFGEDESDCPMKNREAGGKKLKLWKLLHSFKPE